MNNTPSGTTDLQLSVVGFALSLYTLTAAKVQSLLGTSGVIVYVVLASAALLIFLRYRSALETVVLRATEKSDLWLLASTVLVIAIAFAFIYPLVNVTIPGRGSDSDDALNIATMELLSGRYPYYPRTYFGNPITPLPGAILLATPFVLLGTSAYQNFFWLFTFLIAIKRYLHNGAQAVLLVWLILALSPAVLHLILIGSDHVANSIYVLLAMLWTITAATRQEQRKVVSVLAAILFGICLSSRLNFIFLLPLTFFTLLHSTGWKSAVQYTAITGAAFLAVTVPFVVYAPAAFSPLHIVNKLRPFASLVPHPSLVIPAATAVVSLTLAILCSKPSNTDKTDLSVLFRNSAIVLAFPVVCGIALSSMQAGKLELSYAAFGIFFLFFGVTAYSRTLFAVPVISGDAGDSRASD